MVQMKRYPLALMLVSAALAAAEPASPPVKETPAAPTPPTPPRAVSSSTSDLLKSALPKNTFVKPPEKKPETELPDLRDLDKPRNEIVRLPPYLVRERRPPVFRARDFLDEAGRIALGMKRHPGLGAFPLSRLNAPTALLMTQEEERLEDMTAFNDLIRTAGVSDPATRDKLKVLWQQTYLRDNSWVVQRGVSWAESKR